MIIISDCTLERKKESEEILPKEDETTPEIFYVRSKEENVCPVCGGTVKVIGSRKRKLIKSSGERIILIIRRLQCRDCAKIHHELPARIVPYRRHCACTIESIVEESARSVCCENITTTRVSNWFQERLAYFLGCLESKRAGWNQPSQIGSGSLLLRIQNCLETKVHWLKKLVRFVVNLNLWPHTRSAQTAA